MIDLIAFPVVGIIVERRRCLPSLSARRVWLYEKRHREGGGGVLPVWRWFASEGGVRDRVVLVGEYRVDWGKGGAGGGSGWPMSRKLAEWRSLVKKKWRE